MTLDQINSKISELEQSMLETENIRIEKDKEVAVLQAEVTAKQREITVLDSRARELQTQLTDYLVAKKIIEQ